MPVDGFCHPWVSHPICRCTIQASWPFSVCCWPPISVTSSKWLCNPCCTHSNPPVLLNWSSDISVDSECCCLISYRGLPICCVTSYVCTIPLSPFPTALKANAGHYQIQLTGCCSRLPSRLAQFSTLHSPVRSDQILSRNHNTTCAYQMNTCFYWINKCV